jgi:hypothetical protein
MADLENYMKSVIVVTSTELGWDCVVGVYEGVSLEALQAAYKDPHYVYSEVDVETEVPDFGD